MMDIDRAAMRFGIAALMTYLVIMAALWVWMETVGP